MKNYLHIFLLIGALFSTSILMAQKAAPIPTALSESLYTNRDSMTYYASLKDKGDPRGQYVMACSFYYRFGRTIPEGVPFVRTRTEAESLLRKSAAQGYEPAINVVNCLNFFCPMGEEQSSVGGGVSGRGIGSGKSGSVTWSLLGRDIIGSLPRLEKGKYQPGKVVVEIRVNQEGRVISARVASGTNISDKATVDAALGKAREARFSPSDKKQDQIGYITYTIPE